MAAKKKEPSQLVGCFWASLGKISQSLSQLLLTPKMTWNIHQHAGLGRKFHASTVWLSGLKKPGKSQFQPLMGNRRITVTFLKNPNRQRPPSRAELPPLPPPKSKKQSIIVIVPFLQCLGHLDLSFPRAPIVPAAKTLADCQEGVMSFQ